MRRSTILILAAMLSLTACDRGAEPELTTTTTSAATAPSSTVPSTETTQAEPVDTTVATTTPPANDIESYEVQVATSEDEGRVLWVTIPPDDYTDRDLENFVVVLFDEEEDLWAVHVLDDVAAVDAARVASADRTEEEQQLVDAHYLVSLTEGNVVTFHGPFEAAGSFLIGS
jgi:hypothetical protein